MIAEILADRTRADALLEVGCFLLVIGAAGLIVKLIEWLTRRRGK